MAKSKKKPATPAPRSSVAMAHSMRGGAGAGKHHTRTRDVETGRSRRPKHGGQRSLAERENPGERVLDTMGIPLEVTEAEANEIINLILRSLRRTPSASLHWCITREKVFPTKVETLLFLSSDAGNRFRSWEGLKSCLAHAWVGGPPAVRSAASKFGIKRSPLHTGNDPASLRVEYAAYRDMAIQRGVATSPEWFNKAVNKWLDETGETTGYSQPASGQPYVKFAKQPEPEAFVRAAWWLAHVAPGVRLNPNADDKWFVEFMVRLRGKAFIPDFEQRNSVIEAALDAVEQGFAEDFTLVRPPKAVRLLWRSVSNTIRCCTGAGEWRRLALCSLAQVAKSWASFTLEAGKSRSGSWSATHGRARSGAEGDEIRR